MFMSKRYVLPIAILMFSLIFSLPAYSFSSSFAPSGLDSARATRGSWPDSWTTRVSGTTENLYAVAFGSDTFVAIGDGLILTSPDGVTWTTRSSDFASSLWAIAFGNGLFVTVGSSGTIYTSPDGITWTQREPGMTHDLISVAFGNDTFVAVGGSRVSSEGPVAVSSPDGITWTPTGLGSAGWATNGGVAFGNGTFVAALGSDWDSDGQFIIPASPDGKTWHNTLSGVNAVLYDTAFGNGTFVIIGNHINTALYNVILTSPDGSFWTQWTSAVPLYHLAFGKDTFVALGENGTIFTSPDGIKWTMANSGTSTSLQGVTFGKSTFVAVGNNGTILQSSGPAYPLTVSKSGTGKGTVTSSPSGINCGTKCSANFPDSAKVTLTATPGTSSAFTGWSGACSGTGVCEVTMNSAARVTATFTTVKQYRVTASVSGGHGTAIPPTQNINSGGTATITITPATGYHIATIKDNGVVKPLANPYVITNVTAPHAVVVTFTNRQALTVTKDGTGKGTVTSVPAGISCGATCTGNFVQGSTVTLRAVPLASSTFTGWSGGGCSGIGTCKVTIDGAQSVSATFTLKQLTVSASAPWGHGTVTPATQSIDYGASATITITPDAGYRVAAIRDNGVLKKVGTSCVIKNVTANHTVVVTFAAGR